MAQALMKGYPWSERFKRGALRFTFPVHVEPKVDDIRLRLYYVASDAQWRVESFAGKPLHNLGPILEGLAESNLAAQGLREIDAGVQVNGNFADTYRYVRSHTVPDDLRQARVMLHLFDLPCLHLQVYERRRDVLQAVAQQLRFYMVPCVIPWSTLAENAEEVERMYEQHRASGYEGSMVKAYGHQYERKRSFNWFKLKPEETADGCITAVHQAVAEDGTPHPRVGSVTVRLEDGSEASPAGFPHGLAADIWARPGEYIGQWIEFKYMERDRQGGYRHPSFVRFRETKA